MCHLTPPDLVDPAWRAVRACAIDVVHLAARSGRASVRVQGVQLQALRIGVPGVRSPWAFVQLSMWRGPVATEITFVSTLPEGEIHEV